MARTFESERAGRVLTIRFDNPPHNFMNRVMVAELDDLLESIDGDRSIGSVVLTGKPDGVFITHYDVEEILAGSQGLGRSISAGVAGASLQTVGQLARIPGAKDALKRTPAAGMIELRRLHDAFLRMERMDKVFIAALNGSALGGACELSLACDIRYMAESARGIGQPEILLGFPPGGGGTQRLSRAVGPSRALEMILEGRPLTPAEAHEIGLVHRVVPDTGLLAEAAACAERMARRAPFSVTAAKQAVLGASTGLLASGLARERKWFLSSVSQPAAIRAMRAYVERVRSTGPPLADEEALSGWLDGTAVDLVGDD
jgi:enoyl-CoA hydratase/carnithine racemase